MEITGNKNLTLSRPHSANLSSWGRNFLKRAFDILVSLLGLLILSPLFLYLFWHIKRRDPGPVYYRGLRVGKDGKAFKILKFRTMVERPESYRGPRVTAHDDPRTTPLGRWLRDTKLNELPQLWNVLKGEMSLVGPRPEDPEIVKDWPAEARAEILSVRPGITSPASVLYHDEENLLPKDGVMDVYFRDILPDKLRLDRLYVRHRSFTGDLDILLWTAVALLPQLGRERIGEGVLFAGPLYRFVQRRVSWFARDLIICTLAVAAVGSVWRLFGPINWGLLPLALLALVLAALFSSMNVFLGLDRVVWARAGAEDALVLGFSNGMTLLLILLLNYLLERYAWIPLPALPTELVVLMGALAFAGFLFSRYRMRLVTSFASRWLAWRNQRGGFGERTLIVGAGEGGQVVNWLLKRGTLRRAFSVVGMVDDDLAKQGMRIDGCQVLGGSGDLPDLVCKYDVGVVLYTIDNISPQARKKHLKICELLNVRTVFLNDILGVIQTRLAGQGKETG